MAVFVEKENSKNFEILISKIWDIAKATKCTKNDNYYDKTEAYMESQKERKHFASQKRKFTYSDITGKMTQEILKNNQIKISFDNLLSESADPSLWEYSSIELITVYSVGNKVFFSQYSSGQEVVISENMAVSGVSNKFRNILNYWF